MLNMLMQPIRTRFYPRRGIEASEDLKLVLQPLTCLFEDGIARQIHLPEYTGPILRSRFCKERDHHQKRGGEDVFPI